MKILVIGQAPPAVKQGLPYDTTMLYDWLKECGISKEESQNMFTFDAVYDKFPGFNESGGHKTPSTEEMDGYWKRSLEQKVQSTEKVWFLGNVAKNYFYSKPKTWSCSLKIIETMHPSKRNYDLYLKNKQKILTTIKSFIYG